MFQLIPTTIQNLLFQIPAVRLPKAKQSKVRIKINAYLPCFLIREIKLLFFFAVYYR